MVTLRRNWQQQLPSGFLLVFLTTFLSAASLIAPGSAQQELVTALRGAGPNETSAIILKAIQAVQDRAGKPMDIMYRVVPTATAQSDFVSKPAALDFAVGSSPLATSAVQPGLLQIPFAMSTLSIYYNLPGAPSIPVNMTACLLGSLLNGQMTQWTKLLAINPQLTISDKAAVPLVFMEAASAPSSQAINAYLASPAVASCGLTSTALSGTIVSDVGAKVMSTPYAFGYMLSHQGSSYNLKEVALQDASGAFVTSKTMNKTVMQQALAQQLPSSLASDLSTAIQPMGMAGAKVYPIVLVSYMYIRTDQSSTGDKGALLQALAQLLLSSEGQAMPAALGMVPTGATAVAAALTALSSIKLQDGTAAYSIEGPNEVSATGSDIQSISATRKQYNAQLIQDLMAQVASLKATVAQSSPKLLRGSGSSAVSLVVWKALDTFTAMASTPVWLSYRAIGSGGGESEIAGNPIGGPAAVDFGCSDVAMTKPTYDALYAAGVKVMHIPIMIAPVTFFVNIPKTVLPSQKLRLSTCTIAAIFQGGILSWDNAAIAADNPGVTLPAQPILPAYRSSASGTNAVMSQYMATACSSWTLGADKTLPAKGASGTFASSIKAVGSSGDMTTYISNTPWSIGYSDAGNGVSIGLMEVYLKNKAGIWLTSQTADLSVAASQLFQSGGWPSDPTADFSGISLLDQPGDTTWPITSMPFMMIRLDMTSRGDSGQLFKTILSLLMSSTMQSGLPSLGFAPLPADVLGYTVTRSLPLLSVDPRKSAWLLEPSSGIKFTGAGDSVFSQAKDTYTHLATSQLYAASLTSNQAGTVNAAPPPSSNSTFNASSIDLSAIAGIKQMSSRIDELNSQVVILQSIAIAAICFGITGLVLGMFASCRLLVNLVGELSGIMPLLSENGKRRASSNDGGASLARVSRSNSEML